MKRENYLKPQTVREQVALEQGICAGSIFGGPNNTNAVIEAEAQNYKGFDTATSSNEGFFGKSSDNGFEIDWK